MEMAQFEAIVSGEVQGVGFRYYALRQARAIGLSGFVKNLPDGTVEVVAQGGREKLEEMVEWLKKGPDYAAVKKVHVEWQPEGRKFDGFAIEY